MNRKRLLRDLLLGFTLFLSFTTTISAANVLTDTLPLRDRKGDYLRDSVVNPFDLRDPSSIQKGVEYDPITNRYYITEKIGDDYYRTPTFMTFDEYMKFKAQQQERAYFEKLGGFDRKNSGEKVDPFSKVDFSNAQNSKLKMLLKTVGINGKLPSAAKLDVKKLGDNLIGMIFGDPPTVDIRPQGQIDLTLGGDYRYYANPILPTYARTTGGLLFNMDIQMNVTGKIGDKLNLNTAFNNKATFDFDQIMKINYNSNVFSEDDIIKSIEGGNVSLPLRGTLIQGSQNLFGIKTELQFGHLRVTALAAQQKNRRQNLNVQGGSQVQYFSIPIDQYDENKHFFLSHFNRNTFEDALKELPLINSQFSITKLEVWVSNERNEDREVRQIIAFADLGEGDRITNPRSLQVKNGAATAKGQRLPNNDVNDLYDKLLRDNERTRSVGKVVNTLEGIDYNMVQGRDFVKRSAKKLQSTEYTFDPKLGTVSVPNLDRQQILGVAFTYFYNGKGPFQVGEFAENVPLVQGQDSTSRVIFTKMLKSTIQSPSIPLFDLMMRNVYSVGAYVTNPQDLRLDIFYQDAGNEKGEKRTLPELAKKPLLSVLNLDRLNQVGDPQPDGQFDFVPGITINPRSGRIMFPFLEPFGRSLKVKLREDLAKAGYDTTITASIADKYIYQALYDSTLFRAQEQQEKNRFLIKGSVKSTSSNRIQLNAFGLRPGAVTVSAGAYQLLEGVDFAIDYGTSTLTILNSSYVAPNIPLNIAYEDNALFGFQTRTMIGLRADYSVKKKFNLGATFMNLFEQPYTGKVNFGDDPINNKVYGVDFNFTEDAPWLTKLVDKIPLIQTKEPSKITFSAEAALLDPGHSKAINIGNDKGGVVYLDDFEGSSSPFSLMSQPNAWQLASIPQNNARLFPEAKTDSVYSGINRASLNWYRVDQFVREKALDKDNPYVIGVAQTEVFPARDVTGVAFSNYLPTFDIRYKPNERGPYNFDISTGYSNIGGVNGKLSAGVQGDLSLREPQTRWAGIMRGLTQTDFEAANVEYVDFWILDPFLDTKKNNTGGNMYIHLGDISEDILRDSRKMYENGLPSPVNTELKTDPSVWGRIPRTEIPLPTSFSGNEDERKAQDVGLDGMSDAEEKVNFSRYIEKMRPNLNPTAQARLDADPSNDNFTYYNDAIYKDNDNTIAKRYSRFNGVEGNSANTTGQDLQSGTNLPDAEDINRDNSFEENEAYFSYRIPLNPSSFNTATNRYFIESLNIGNGTSGGFKNRVWHHFRVPIDAFESKHGQISDFRSIRFMRIVMKDFDEETVVRFAKMDLIRNQWRRYKRDLSCNGFSIGNNTDLTGVELLSVSIEENSKRTPFNYILPPGIERQQLATAFAANARQNEQSLGIRVTGLQPCKSKSAFKLFSSDLRIYERIKMFVHAESPEGNALNGKLSAFMRVGADFEKNYYEYELPLTVSDQKKLTNVQSNGSTAAQYAEEVWKKENTFDFAMSLFTKAKLERNSKNIPLSEEYLFVDPENPLNKVKVKGNPDIGLVKGIMVGVSNKDLSSHDVEIWINELRCTGLNENAGGAALARMDVKMADFGNLALAGSYLGIGYGAIDQKVQQRSREEVTEYSLNGRFELGKFFPVKSGIHIPFNIQHSNNTRTPEFDPYDLDLKLKDKIAAASGPDVPNIKAAAKTIQVINGISFDNVRKDRTNSERKPAPWDIENFSASYAQTSVERRDPLVLSDNKQSYKGSLDYQYSREPLYVTPFKKLIKSEKVEKYFKLITDFNFNPIPNSVGLNTILDRQVNVTQYRFSGEDAAYNTFYARRFNWDRNYNLQWDLTRSLKLNFDAKNVGVVDELNDFDDNGDPVDLDARRTKLNDGLQSFGRTKRYDQNINVNYTVPTRNIPYMDWVQIRATYGANYGWEAAALNFEKIGNNISNKQNRQLNADLNFTSLYNQIKYLRDIQTPIFAPPTDGKKPKKSKKVALPTPSLNLPKKDGDAVASDSTATKGKRKRREGEERLPTVAEKVLIRPFLLLRNGRLNYTEGLNSYVPGYLPQSRQFGMSDLSSPGWDYVLGYQQSDDDWLDDAGKRSWISRDIRQTRPTLNNYTQQIDARLSIEPFQDFRVDIDLTKNYTRNRSQEFRDTTENGTGGLIHTNRFEDGSYTVSYFTLNTMFTDINTVFQQFLDNRPLASQALNPTGLPHPEATGYKLGFGPTSNDVLIPAFIAAYTGRDMQKTLNGGKFDLFKEKPSANWRLTYNGLAKLPGLRDVFQNISITHGYKSSLTTNSFRTSPFYDPAKPNQTRVENKYDYYPQYDIPSVVISEQFAPLLGIDASMKSGATFGIQYRKSRNLALSISDSRMQESKVSEIQLKFGHRLKNIYIAFLDFDIEKKLMSKEKEKRLKEEEKRKKAEEKEKALAEGKNAKADPNAPKKKREPKPKKGNDLVINFDLSFRDDQTENHLFGAGAGDIPSRGSQTLRVSPSVTYTVNKLLDLRFFVDYNRTIPYTSAAFPSTTGTGGFVITYKLN
jgi:cell surface protein SprA